MILQVKVFYKSSQKMSSLGVGLIQGIGNHYGEELEITQTFPNDTKEKCEILVRKSLRKKTLGIRQ